MKLVIALTLLLVAGISAAAQSKVCRKHPEWTADECANVASKKLFVGMTREMVNAEKPHSCVLDRHPVHRQPGMVQFLCYTQWDHSMPDHTLPYILRFQFTDGRVSAFSYN
jgi:hypothetical protein